MRALALIGLVAGATAVSAVPARAAAPPRKGESGTFRFAPSPDEKELPRRYQLKPAEYAWRMDRIRQMPVTGVTVYHLRFPSPVKTDTPENNTVHAEYYRPVGKGPFPAVIVLDVTAGNQSLSRGIATHLAQNGIAGLFVQMAYYGPRRPPSSNLRLLMPDLNHSLGAIRQTVLDL